MISDPVNEIFHLVPDSKMNVNIDFAAENETFTVIEGSKKLTNCDDKYEDISLKGKFWSTWPQAKGLNLYMSGFILTRITFEDFCR